ncbi:J domain-containing protein [Variovorax sp. NFACC27]|jgi:DnaJ domain|uniref:DnaJ domain-containing protein n=1 Tax=Variovorax paradoxus TaxID=34073 RepID=A0A5Q0M050_VARPD|nr:J domain-containing protein [Variovorax paradoxus]SEF19378.1 DnaJ domain-containing protein [Variovorax sp. NFACC28]SEF73133.1 DnaJ domain-containing protein [Variovorax sp. NFACC29]SFB77594.1 DnaJ domain-containing protein [Variovorax sp. NFACC26]SFG77133.1 DnaJ domain-containing protein [Variovorax sp. NFACC27]QFZ81862.1 DnaJ domain-containing protein [Variovorax paradoxus]
MNHYEVLGIRPSASQQEIELAYRGRRTQYHPDKYATADVDTVKWATNKMQEVNAAYAALSDPVGRKAFDSRPQADEGPRQPRATEKRPVRTSLQELLSTRLAPYVGFSRIYFAPRIPVKKLSAARGNYAVDLKEEDVVALIDTTVFGGAKEGIVLTQEGVRVKELMSAAVDLPWTDIRSLDIRGTAIWVNGHQVADCPMVDKPELERLFAVVREFLREPSPNGASGAASEASHAASNPAPWTDPVLSHEVYVAAKQRLIELSDLLEPVEQEVGEEWLDRQALANLFELSGEALGDPRKAKLAYRWVLEVGRLCEAAVTSLNQGGRSIDQDLFQGNWDEPVAIRDLRSVLKNLFSMIHEEREKERANRFFER